MKSFSHKGGFTLIEVIIAVALVAIMAVAIAPPLVQNIKQGKITRAQNDAQSIGTAILNYYKDVGDWPVREGGTDLTILVSNASLGGGTNGIPGGSAAVAGSNNWRLAPNPGTISEHLIKNKTAALDPLIAVSRNPNSSTVSLSTDGHRTRTSNPFRSG